jgi:glutamate synthase (NADPH/NADH) small chain
VVLAGGAEQPRDLPVPGRELKGVHFAMDFLPLQNKVNAGDKVKDQMKATGKHVVVIGGGDTGSDCVGTSNRHGAASVTQFELMPHAAGAGEQAAGLALLADQAAHLLVARGRLRTRLGRGHQAPGRQGRQGREADRLPRRMEGRQDERSAGLGIRDEGRPGAAGHGLRVAGAKVLDAFGVEKDARGNAKASTDGEGCYKTSAEKCLPPATCAAASRWWCGRSAKAVSARVRSTSS